MTRRVSKHGTTPCECGCGQPVPGRFVSGHNARVQRPTPFDDSYEVRDCGHDTPCWVCRWRPNKTGYCLLTVDGVRDYAHRHAYRRFKGEIPAVLTLDHLCRNTRCMNPEHLEAVSIRTNILRGTSLAANNARKTHCVRGHEFTPENTRVRTKGRSCRACDALAAKRTNEKRKAARHAHL